MSTFTAIILSINDTFGKINGYDHSQLDLILAKAYKLAPLNPILTVQFLITPSSSRFGDA